MTTPAGIPRSRAKLTRRDRRELARYRAALLRACQVAAKKPLARSVIVRALELASGAAAPGVDWHTPLRGRCRFLLTALCHPRPRNLTSRVRLRTIRAVYLHLCNGHRTFGLYATTGYATHPRKLGVILIY